MDSSFSWENAVILRSEITVMANRDHYKPFYGKIIAERMITMCKVYEFPKQLELPKEEQEMLYLLGEGYIAVLCKVLFTLNNGEATEAELREAHELVRCTLLEGMIKAIEKKEKGF